MYRYINKIVHYSVKLPQRSFLSKSDQHFDPPPVCTNNHHPALHICIKLVCIFTAIYLLHIDNTKKKINSFFLGCEKKLTFSVLLEKDVGWGYICVCKNSTFLKTYDVLVIHIWHECS